MSNPPDELTRSTMVALIARWSVAYQSNLKQEELKKAAEKAIEENGTIIQACRAACKSLGYDRDNKESWNQAMRLFREDANNLYNQTKPEGLPPLISHEKKAIEAIEHGSGEDISQPKETLAETQKPRPPIRQIALDRLSVAGEPGLKASEIRDYIEKTYPNSTDIHEKTVGMTLYRLLKDNLVRREGHTWFFVPPKAEAKNPAGETAGLETSYR